MTAATIVTVAAFATALIALLFAAIACDAARHRDAQIKVLRLQVDSLVLQWQRGVRKAGAPWN